MFAFNLELAAGQSGWKLGLPGTFREGLGVPVANKGVYRV